MSLCLLTILLKAQVYQAFLKAHRDLRVALRRHRLNIPDVLRFDFNVTSSSRIEGLEVLIIRNYLSFRLTLAKRDCIRNWDNQLESLRGPAKFSPWLTFVSPLF